jgi:uncharacterized protein (TIGR02246 family)
MNKLLMVILLVFLLCFTFSCQQSEEVAEESVVDVESDVEAIKMISQELDVAFQAGDVTAFVALITEDAIFMPPNEPTLHGKQAVESRYQAMFQKLFETFRQVEHTLTVEEVKICKGWAFARGSYNLTLVPKTGDWKVQNSGKNIHIYEKQPDGAWRISRDIWNSNNPPPPKAPPEKK